MYRVRFDSLRFLFGPTGFVAVAVVVGVVVVVVVVVVIIAAGAAASSWVYRLLCQQLCR